MNWILLNNDFLIKKCYFHASSTNRCQNLDGKNWAANKSSRGETSKEMKWWTLFVVRIADEEQYEHAHTENEMERSNSDENLKRFGSSSYNLFRKYYRKTTWKRKGERERANHWKVYTQWKAEKEAKLYRKWKKRIRVVQTSKTIK